MELMSFPARILGVILIILLFLVAVAFFIMMVVSRKRKSDPTMHFTIEDEAGTTLNHDSDQKTL